MSAIDSRHLEPSEFVDSDHPDIIELADSLTKTDRSEQARAVTLYYWVRDEVRYNPYALQADPASYRASTTLAAGEGWCVPKALLLAALCRAAGVPARVGFADVRNHLSTARMREMMETDLFYFHGYTAIYLDEHWRKATPAFNIGLCERFGLLPLEFDGTADSIYHPFDKAGNRHMEYVNDRGEHVDLPFDEMMAVFRRHYPRMIAAMTDHSLDAAIWDQDVTQEVTD